MTDFDVYLAGETLEGTDIGSTYVYITTPLGQVRMTEEEAENLGRCLLGAARTYRDGEDHENQLAAAHAGIESTVTSETTSITRVIAIKGAPKFAGHTVTSLEVTYQDGEAVDVSYGVEFNPKLTGKLPRVQPAWFATIINRHRPTTEQQLKEQP